VFFFFFLSFEDFYFSHFINISNSAVSRLNKSANTVFT